MVLTLGLVTYAASVLAVPADARPVAASVKQVQQTAVPVGVYPEQLRGSVNEAGNGLHANAAAQGPKESPRLTAHVPAGVVLPIQPEVPRGAADRSASEDGLVPGGHSLLRDVQVVEDARAVQRRLAELGHFSGVLSGVWGRVSRAALRSFKEANGLARDANWDAETERALFRSDAPSAEPFVGRWAADMRACSNKAAKSGYLPTVIETSRARAGDVSCSFIDKRQTGGTWRVVAQCASGAEKWTAHIDLTVAAVRLTWTSERGSQVYVRCQQPIETRTSASKRSDATLARLQ